MSGLVASCAWASGEVQVRRPGEAFWEPVTTGTLFRSGDWLRTGALSGARIELFSGGGLDLEQSTLVVLALTPNADGEAEPLLKLESGEIRETLEDARSRAREPSVSLRAADGSRLRVVGAQSQGGSIVSLGQREGSTRIAISEGAVELESGSGERRALVAGQLLELVSGAISNSLRMLGGPEPIEPACESRLLAEGEPLELRWVPVDGAEAYRVQVARDASFRALLDDELTEEPRLVLPCPAEGRLAWRVAAVDPRGNAGRPSLPRIVACGAGTQIFER
jgi:hypothetical protein